jgi:hypothetical protein
VCQRDQYVVRLDLHCGGDFIRDSLQFGGFKDAVIQRNEEACCGGV